METKTKEIIDTKKLTSIIDEFVALFKIEKNYFKEEIETFIKRKKDLEKSRIYIGVIGITSSGKSTLLNSILGEKLLPARVRPSSGVQVICEYGPQTKAVIIFKKESKRPDKEIVKNVINELERFGDETKNPQNKENVEEIRLFSSNFCLDRNVTIVDTPGLDAFGFANHEKITLQLVVPTVQMILFLTTIKSSSDSKNLELIDQVTAENKPLLVVQNMIDSVVEKCSTEGVEKTSEEVLTEHKERLIKLLKKAKKNSVQKAPVVQLSAIKALNNRHDKNFSDFIEVLSDLIKETAPERLTLFSNQLKKSLLQLAEKLDSIIKGDIERKKLQEKEKIKLNNSKKLLDDCRNKVVDFLEKNLRENSMIIEKANQLIIEIEKKYEYNKEPNSFDTTLKRRIDDLLGKDAESITSAISIFLAEINKLLKGLCNELNLREDEIIKRNQFNEIKVRVEIPHETKKITKTRSVKKSGFKGWAARFFSFGIFGYEDEYYTVSEDFININKLIKDFSIKMEEFNKAIFFFQESIERDTNYSLGIIEDKLYRKEESDKKKFEMLLDIDLCKRLLCKIDVYTGLIDSNVYENKGYETKINSPAKDDLRRESCAKLGVNIYHLAHNQSFKYLFSYREKLIDKCGNNKNILIYGWDTLQINRFIDNFYSDIIYKRLDDENYSFKINNITIINEGNKHSDKKLIVASDTICFVLINTIQIGDSTNKYFKSQLVTNNGQYIWVMDSIKEHINNSNNNIVEAFGELCRFIHSTKKQTISILVSDRDLYYSVLFHELFFNAKKWKRMDIQQFINKLHSIEAFKSHDKNKTGEYIKTYIDNYINT